MKKICNLLRTNEQIIRYLIAGVATTFISLTSYYLLTMIFDPTKPIQLQIANIISWVLAVSFAFVVNKHFVFKTKTKNIKSEFLKFLEARLLTLFIDSFSMFAMVNVLNMNDKFAKLFVQIIVLILNYLISKFIVFSNNKEVIK